MTAFSKTARDAFAANYPEIPVKLTHRLLDHPLLTLPSLVELAAKLREEDVEYNPGNLPIGIAPEDVPSSQLDIAETIRSIEVNGSWMVLKLVEQHPAYQFSTAGLAQLEHESSRLAQQCLDGGEHVRNGDAFRWVIA